MLSEEELTTKKNKEIKNEEENQTLNEAYEKAAQAGVMPNFNDFSFSGNEDGFSRKPFGEEFSQREEGEPLYSDYGTPITENSFDFSGNEPQNNPQETTSANEEPFSLKTVIDGSFFENGMFARVFPFLVFLVLLSVLYISNRNIAESLIRKNIVLKREVRELRAESITIAAELMNISKETEIANRISKKQLGLHEQKEPPKYIVIDKFERADSLKKREVKKND